MRIEINGLAWFDKAELPETTIDYLKKQLTLTQRVSKEYAGRSKPAIVELWVDDKDKNSFGVPRSYFYDTVTQAHDIVTTVSKGEPWPARVAPVPDADGNLPEWAKYITGTDDLTLYDTIKNCPVSLKPEQQAALDSTVAHVSAGPANGGLVQAPTGWGKSIFAIVLARALKMKTAILVHREFLSDQWVKRINQFLPDCKVGIIAGKKYNTDGCHIVLVMIETVASWAKKGKIPERLRNEFGLVIADEVHRAAAPSWGMSLPQFNCAHRIGISAHPTRSDGLEKVLSYHIGRKIYTGTALSRTPKVRRVYSKYALDNHRINPNVMSMEFAFKLMSNSPIYNQDVTDQIKLAVAAGRKIFVFSHTVKHLQRLKEMFDDQMKEAGTECPTDFYIGGMDEDARDQAAEATVIFGTYQMAKDSLDIPALDTVVLAGPIRNPTQPGGRCCRDFPNKKDPIIVDMRADNVPVFRDYGESRDRTYEKIYLAPPVVTAQIELPKEAP